MNFFRSLYITDRFFLGITISALAFVLTYAFDVPALGILVRFGFLLFLAVGIIDLLFLYRTSKGIFALREAPERLSNGDDNPISIYLENHYPFNVDLELVDEIPHQFQIRDAHFKMDLPKGQNRWVEYKIKPFERGSYSFGALNVYVNTGLRLFKRRYRFSQDVEVPVYPSYLQMRKYEIMAIGDRFLSIGVKKMRRIGQSMEFERIKEYVLGDDPRNVNWKATARSNKLMVNQYTDERSQQVYCLIDKGRVMRMPFEGMTLLDYAINAALVISNIAIKKDDKAGLISFSDSMGSILPASKRGKQMRLIQEMLYREETDFLESDHERLYLAIRRKINRRSLLLLFTNFETLSGLKRQLPYLKSMARHHLLVVIFFENTELKTLTEKIADNVEDIYNITIAEKLAYEKRLIVKELQKHGIQSILTPPQQLTVNTINKYLELKSRGMI